MADVNVSPDSLQNNDPEFIRLARTLRDPNTSEEDKQLARARIQEISSVAPEAAPISTTVPGPIEKFPARAKSGTPEASEASGEDTGAPGPLKSMNENVQAAEPSEGPAKRKMMFSPVDANTTLGKMRSVSLDLKPEQKQAFDEEFSKLDTTRKQWLDDYKNDRDNIGWASVAETFGHALAQLGAGYYGLKHNVDLSGLKFNKQDWKQDYDNLLSDLQLRLQDIRDQRKDVEGRQGRAEKRAEREGTLQQNVISKADERQNQNYASEVLLNERLDATTSKLDNMFIKMNMSQLDKEEKLINDQIKNKIQLKNELKQEGDLTKKNLDYLTKTYGKTAGASGVDLADVRAQYDKNAPKRNARFGVGSFSLPIPGWTVTDTDNPASGTALDKALGLDVSQQALQTIREKKQALMGGRGQGQPTSSVVAPANASGASNTPAPPVSAAPAASGTSVVGGPKPGDVKGGYRFKGGNPADKNNWEKV